MVSADQHHGQVFGAQHPRRGVGIRPGGLVQVDDVTSGRNDLAMWASADPSASEQTS
jgi:hypothetical protein